MQPRDWKTRRWESTTARTCGSKGRSRNRHRPGDAAAVKVTFERRGRPSRQSQRAEERRRPRFALVGRPGSAVARRPTASGARHQTDAVDGRMPTTPQNAAGLRSDPPMSVPSAIGSIPHASATAAPPLLPPHVFVRSYGLSVAPKTGLNVCDPAPNSGVLVLPTVIAPARFNRATSGESASGT